MCSFLVTTNHITCLSNSSAVNCVDVELLRQAILVCRDWEREGKIAQNIYWPETR